MSEERTELPATLEESPPLQAVPVQQPVTLIDAVLAHPKCEKLMDVIIDKFTGGRALERAHDLARIHAIARYALVAAILWLGYSLRMDDKLDAVSVGLLSGALGFLFGRQKSDS